uniref:Uncharacterized protein n=1 Tax=Tanacetum cinerariifolium TaxID=118510 RepID=A0A699HB40_TANCI|nr:hypothetical protein [Tanacetum cinerariifolium]
MSLMRELTFFLGLQVKQKPDGIFISKDKYVAEILRKFSLTDGKSASTLIDTEKPLLKDPDGQTTTGKEISNPFMSGSLPKTMLLTFIHTINDITRLQALVDKKKVVVTEDTIRDALRLADAEGIECLPNEEIFTELARMGYEKPSTKLTFYKAFFSPQWEFLIHTILQCMSAKRTSWNEFSSSMASAVICLSTDRKFNFFKAQVGDLSSHSTKYTSSALIQKVFANMRRVGKGFFEVDTTFFEGMLVAKEVGESADEVHVEVVPTDDVAAEGGKIANIDADEDVVLEDANDVVVEKSVDDEESKPAELQEVVNVVTTTKIMIEVVTVVNTTITAADASIPTATITVAPSKLTTAPSAARRRKEVVIRDPEETATPSIIIHFEAKTKDKRKGILVEEPKPLKKQAQIEQDEAYARELEAELNKNIDWDEVIDHVHKKAKEVMMKTKQQKGRSWIKKVKELRRHLQIVPNDEDDVYTEATPLALKVPVVDYEIYNEHNKPYYKIKRANDSHQLYLSFLSMLRNFDREDLEALWRLVKERFATTKPKNFSDDFLLTTLGAMFKKPDIITFTTTQLILLVERKYLLTRSQRTHSGFILKMPKLKSFITLEGTLSQEELNNQIKELKRISNMKAQKDKSEQELRKMFNQATLKAQAKKWTKHEAKKAKIDDNPLNLIIHPNFRLKSLGFSEWLEEKKRKRIQFLKEAFITEDIRVDGMNKNMIPSPEVVPIKGLIIKEPESRIFYMNMNTDIVFQRESEFHLTPTVQLIRIQNQIKVFLEIADEIFKKMIYVIKARSDCIKARETVEKNLDNLG